ncbi:MAG TPA: MopE-related protein [Candidatus Polarisedimenticolia bacterium]|nr:MopE-related protein [Candidatus Polarisedimenticolia bacterium]
MNAASVVRLVTGGLLALALLAGGDALAGTTCAQPDLLPQFTSFPGVVAFDGLVGPSFAHGSDGYAFVAVGYDVQVILLDESGVVVLGPQPGLSPPWAGQPSGPVVAWDGAGYAVAWYDLGRSSVLFVRVGADGRPVGPYLELPARPPNGIDSPELIWTGSEYALLWIDTGNPNAILLARIGADGTLLGSPVAVASGLLQQIAFARGAHGYGVVWIEENQPFFQQRAHFLALTADGTAAGPEVLSTLEEGVSGSPPAIAWAGDRYAVTWSSYPGIRLAFFGEDGHLLGPLVMAWDSMGNDVWSKSLAWTGSELMLAWQKPNGDQDIHARRFGQDGTPLGPDVRLTRGSGHPFVGRLLWTGDRFAMAWSSGYATSNRGRFGFIACDCPDADGDDYTTCRSDCDDTSGGVHPGAYEFCNAVDDDCDGAIDEGLAIPVTCGTGSCLRTVIACTDGVPNACLPGLPSAETCNGLDDNCDGVIDNPDSDGDGAIDCGQDCAPADPTIHPGAIERCNGLDDDCNGVIDDRNAVVDSDADGVPEACDNCPVVANAGQEDQDHDGVGNLCDNCPAASNPSQADSDGDGTADACDLCPLSPYPTTDVDGDGLGAACDNCPNVANAGQEDSDFDHVGDACDRCPGLGAPNNDDSDGDTLGDPCDNCPSLPNHDQSDVDEDGEGDACDLNDGLLMIWGMAPDEIDWDSEPGFLFYDVYRGDIDRLKATGESTQDPETVPLAAQSCGQLEPFFLDDPPPVGKGVFYLVAVTTSSGYQGIGDDSAGHPRHNAHPCP